MPEDMNGRLKKELEDILQGDDGRRKPCRYYRLVPPPGCILGWDISQCNFCSFYRPVEGMEKEEDGGK